MKLLVVGASRGTGAAAVDAAVGAGHRVTAFARSITPAAGVDDVRRVAGDVMDRKAVEKAMIGQDAVIVTLGISDNPIGVRLRRRASSPLNVRSAGTATVIEAMQAQSVRRLVVQSTYGIGTGYRRLPLSLKASFTLVIRPQVRDHERQERLVRESGLDWTIVRPVVLDDQGAQAPAGITFDDDVTSMRVARTQVAQVLVSALGHQEWVSRTLSISE